jgi:hypothetical protein
MTTRVLVFAEDVLGMTLARDLCDRVVVERGPIWLRDLWDDSTKREEQRTWAGVELGAPRPWSTWEDALEQAQRHGVVAQGLGLKGYAKVAYRTARLAAHLVTKLQPAPDLVVFCIDTDGDETVAEQMREGVERANVGGLPISLAVMHQESEAWVVAGFVPENTAEELALRQLKSNLKFDPTSEPHRLTSRRQTEPRDAKRVCKSLVPEVPHSERARRCWLDTSLDDLERRGAQTGLPEYLAAVKAIVLPALSAPISRR